MKNLFKWKSGRNILCSLCLALGTTVLTFYGSFLFLGEPKVPDCLKEK